MAANAAHRAEDEARESARLKRIEESVGDVDDLLQPEEVEADSDDDPGDDIDLVL